MILTPAQSEIIRQTIRSCGQQAKTLAAQHYEVFQKTPGDFVTSVDQALDRRFTEFFTDLFPHDGVITEENAASRKQYQEGFSRLWCIDPIDGTGDFIRGDRNYAIHVGLLENKQPIAGWICAPHYDLTYWGDAKSGVWQAQGDEAPQLCRIPGAQRLTQYRVMIGDQDFRKLRDMIVDTMPEVQFVRTGGSFGLKVMSVVVGQTDLYLYFNRRVKVWDTAAPIAIAQAAGLVCCDLSGAPISFASDALDLETLAHQQPIVIGWAPYIQALLPRLRDAIDPEL